MMGRKVISLKEKTYDRLAEHGKAGESFDELVNRLLDKIESPAGVKGR